MTEEFHIQYKISNPYHPQENGAVKALNKILENAFTKVCNTNHNDWNLKIPAILWAYRMMCKIMTCHTPLKLVYGKEAVMPKEYIILSLCIAALTGMCDEGAIEESLAHLLQLEEDRFIVGFH